MHAYRKIMLCAAVGLALSGASGFASAQSPEYRQGYEQGYRDGMETQKHMDAGGPVGHIVIEEAHYGRRDQGVCDAREVIQRAIGWRRHFDIHVGNELCGDPAPHEPKHLHVRYRCGDSQSAEAEAPESSVMSLSCQ
jgi:hypothetical protein